MQLRVEPQHNRPWQLPTPNCIRRPHPRVGRKKPIFCRRRRRHCDPAPPLTNHCLKCNILGRARDCQLRERIRQILSLPTHQAHQQSLPECLRSTSLQYIPVISPGLERNKAAAADNPCLFSRAIILVFTLDSFFSKHETPQISLALYH